MNTEESFIKIYDEYSPKIFKYCLFRVSSKEEAEDLASQTFLKAWDYTSTGKEIDNFQAFLYQIAHNLVVDHYRKGRSSKEISIDNPDNPIDIPENVEFVDTLDQELALRDVRQKLDELPDNYKEIITLRYVNDLSIKEIAQAMSITENNASVILHRATEKLKKLT